MYLKNIMDNKNKNKKQISFHMPGHKENYKFFENDIVNYDLTEYDEFDNLANPETVIKNSINRIERIFESEKSFILVNGSTSGILATLFYLNNIKGKILAYRYSHKSFFNGILLTGQEVDYITPIINQDGFFFKLNYDDIEEKLKTKEFKALFLTSPTYEGVYFDIERLGNLTKKYGAILIVDEAHGAHFNLHTSLPPSSTKYADIVINSLHKTLPAMTQTALLHTTNKHKNIETYINMIQTSSPSYVFMYTIDKLMEDIEENNLDFDKYIFDINYLRHEIKKLNNIKILDIPNIDITRITLYSNKITSSDFNNYLKEHNIYCEMYINNYLILITSICDKFKDYTYLIDILKKLDKELDKSNYTIDNKYNFIYNSIDSIRTKSVYTFKEVSLMDDFYVNLEDCLGLVTKEAIIPYPPGIPILLPGECITKEIINAIKNLLNENVEILGVKDNSVKVIRGEWFIFREG